MRPAITVVIPTHRRIPQIISLLKSLQIQNSIADTEVLVVANFPDRKLEKIVYNFQANMNVSLLVVSRAGVNASRNLGWSQAQGSIVQFLDDDCKLHKVDYLQSVLRAHENFPDTHVLGGSYESESCSTFEQKAYNLLSNTWAESYQFMLEQNWALLGGNVSYKSSVRDSGLCFNEDILYGGSETEFQVRLFSQGFRMKFLSQLGVVHKPSVTVGLIFAKALKQARTSELFQLPQKSRAHALSKYLYVQKSAKLAQTQKELKKYLEVFRLHEDAFLYRSEYQKIWKRSRRLAQYHWKSKLC